VVVVGLVFELVLWLYLLLLLARIVADWVQMFARSWHPGGATLVGLEVVYTATDPPIKALRRIIPPLRLGGAAIDLSIMIVLLLCLLLRIINHRVLLGA
jgi:YggT family protein